MFISWRLQSPHRRSFRMLLFLVSPVKRKIQRTFKSHPTLYCVSCVCFHRTFPSVITQTFTLQPRVETYVWIFYFLTLFFFIFFITTNKYNYACCLPHETTRGRNHHSKTNKKTLVWPKRDDLWLAVYITNANTQNHKFNRPKSDAWGRCKYKMLIKLIFVFVVAG